MIDLSSALSSLAQCLCAEMRDAGPALCFCGVVPGQAALPEYMADCENNGMAWVRLALTYPASGVGVVNQNVGNCGSGLGFDVEVGVVREHVLQEEPLTDVELLAISQQQIADMRASRRAIMCCDAFTSKDFILGSYTPQGPLGGIVGGYWTVYLMVD